MSDDDLLTVPEAMTALRIGKWKLYDLMRSGELLSISIGRSRRIPRFALAQYVTRLIKEAA